MVESILILSRLSLAIIEIQKRSFVRVCVCASACNCEWAACVCKREREGVCVFVAQTEWKKESLILRRGVRKKNFRCLIFRLMNRHLEIF